ncbi:MAG: glycosyltransferase family 2 protein [Gemmatimonadota bacterium]
MSAAPGAAAVDPRAENFDTRGLKVLVVAFAWNEGERILRTLGRLPRPSPFLYAVADDGSTDGSLEAYARFPDVRVFRHERNRGLGAAMKTVNRAAFAEGVDVIAHMAGNDKDDPEELPRLLRPIVEEGYDFVQGSRYVPGGRWGNTPPARLVATRFVHPLLFSLVARRRVRDTTNGFVAFRTRLLRDPRIRWEAEWLDGYELQYYFSLKAIRLGYRFTEVPVTKVYPAVKRGYSKVKPVTGWWEILKPLAYAALGVRQ